MLDLFKKFKKFIFSITVIVELNFIALSMYWQISYVQDTVHALCCWGLGLVINTI